MSFPKYPEYKHTSVNWLEATPESWNLLQGKRVFSQRKERTFSEDQQLAASQVYGVIPQKKMMEMTGNKVMLALGGTNSFRRVAQDDFVISLRSFEGGIEHSAYNGCVSPAYTVLAPNRTIHPWFYRYLLKSRPYVSALQASTDSLRDGKSITFEQFGVIALPYPSVSEQRQIARFLDHETAKIDTLIQEQKRLIELLKEKRQALVLSAFSLSDSVETRLANAVNLIYKPVSQKVDETYIPIGLFNRGRGLFHKDPRGIEEMGESDFFWVNDGDLIISGQFAWEGAVALAGEKEQGKVVSHRYPILRGKNGIVTTEYIFALLTTRHGDFLLNENSRGAAGRNKPLNISALLKEKITIPAFSLQNKIVEIVHQERQIKAEASRQKKLLLEHRAALISAAVTGKIDVRGWQPPAYESAFDEEIRQAEIKVTA